MYKPNPTLQIDLFHLISPNATIFFKFPQSFLQLNESLRVLKIWKTVGKYYVESVFIWPSNGTIFSDQYGIKPIGQIQIVVYDKKNLGQIKKKIIET